MPSDEDSFANAEALFTPNASSENHMMLQSLQSQTDELEGKLLDISSSSDPEATQARLCETLSQAREALRHCQNSRHHLRRSADEYRRVHDTWTELQRRRRVLSALRDALADIQQIHAVAQIIGDAQTSGDHMLMAETCVRFESLNASGARRLDDTYICLHSVSERVSLAVAASMRMLRASLRNACTKFDAVQYRKCMTDFDNLGAASHFASHVLQVFEEEATQIYREATALEARASQKVISFFSMLSRLVGQFFAVIHFHAQAPDGELETVEEEELRRSVASSLESLTPPFRHFASTTEKLVGELKFALIMDQTTTLLRVFESSSSFCELAMVANSFSFDDHQGGSSFRSKTGAASPHHARLTNSTSGVILRRARSQSRLERIELSSSTKKPGRRAWVYDFDRPIAKVMKDVALGCLSVTHARHAEELGTITNTPECWVRIRVPEDAIRELLNDVLSGTDDRIKGARRQYRNSMGGNADEHNLLLDFRDTNPSAWTLTTASLSVLRWTSEYLTIGITAPSALSDSLSNVADLFLMFLYASVDMKSRVEQPDGATLLKAMEDLMLERPCSKSITDFIPPTSKKLFQTFMNRYGTPQRLEDWLKANDLRWGCERTLHLSHYSAAPGVMFSNALTSRQAIVRQCVAADGIATLCEVLEAFCVCIEDLVVNVKRLSESYEAEKMGSLRSAVSLGQDVQNAFFDLLAWDIIGGWDAVSAVAETCRSFHLAGEEERHVTATEASPFVEEMLTRIKSCYLEHLLPPRAAEQMGVVISSTAMGVLLDGFASVRQSSYTAAASQMLFDLRTLDLALVELTGVHPCPGRLRVEMFVKATFLNGSELERWIERHKRRLGLLDRHVQALLSNQEEEIPIVDQIITP